MMIFSDALCLATIIRLSKLKGPQLEVVKTFIISMKDRFRRAADLADELAAAADALKDEQALSKAWDELNDWKTAITKRLWWAGSSKITDVSFGSRVYFQDELKWWSYDLSARSKMVQDYQFRSPSEWFAEVYAVEMLGKLSDGHPCKGLIRGLDSTKKLTE